MGTLGLLSEKIAADPFGKVKKMIDSMLTRLLNEANQDATHEGFCDKEMGENKLTRDKLSATVSKLTAEIETQKANLVDLTTEISDLTKEEFKAYLGYKKQNKTYNIEVPEPEIIALFEDEVDWRTKGLVTPVKDQGSCGSCWAFSATETVESAFLRSRGLDASLMLSEQEVVSCDTQDGGCNGGDLPSAFEYIQGAGGLASEKSYPYTSGNTGRNGNCKKFTPTDGTTPMKWYFATPECYYGGCRRQDEGAVARTLRDKGPLGICVNAENWQNYQSGVMNKHTCGSSAASAMDHCVQLVGYKGVSTIYEESNAAAYWIVRNSWAADWGEEGFIRLKYGQNTCGVANEAMYVELQ